MKVCGADLGDWANGGYVDVLWGVGPIVRNECGIWGQNYVTLFLGNEMSAGLHSRNLLLVLECLLSYLPNRRVLLYCFCVSVNQEN